MPQPWRIEVEVVDVLTTWLDREVKSFMQNVDSKLDRLLASSGTPNSCTSCDEVKASQTAIKSTISNDKRPERWLQASASSASLGEGSSSGFRARRARSLELLLLPEEDVEEVDSLSADKNSPNSGTPPKQKTLEVPKRTEKRKSAEVRSIILQHLEDYGTLSARIWRSLENPYSSRAASFYFVFISLCTVASVGFSFWQSIEGCPLTRTQGNILQMVFEVAFGFEVLVRYFVSPDKGDFWRDYFNYVDMISSLPLPFRGVIVIMAISSSENDSEDLLSRLAFVPILRLLKLMRHFESFQLLVSAFFVALEVLPVILYTMSIISLFFSSLFWICEPRENIKSLPHALWFTIVTMTTVGYGDATPETAMGHIIATLLMIISVCYMSIPIGIVGNAFSQVWDMRERLLLMRRFRQTFLAHGFNAKALRNIMTEFDVDGDGEFSFDEFETMLRAMHMNISPERIIMLMNSLDSDGSGSVNMEELMNGLFPKDLSALLDSMGIKNVENAKEDVFISQESRYASQETASQESRYASQESRYASRNVVSRNASRSRVGSAERIGQQNDSHTTLAEKP